MGFSYRTSPVPSYPNLRTILAIYTNGYVYIQGISRDNAALCTI